MPRYEAGHGKLFRKRKNGKLTGNWKFKFQGRDINTKTKERKAAERFRREFLASPKPSSPASKPVTIDGLFQLVVGDYRRRGLRTIDRLQSRIIKLNEVFAGRLVSDLGVDDVIAYSDLRTESGAAPATVNRELETLRRALNLGLEHEVILRAPKIRMLPENNTRDLDVSPDVYSELLAALREPVRLMAIIAYHIGWRAGKIRELRWSQVDFEQGVIHPPANQAETKWVGAAPIYGDLRRELLKAQAEHERYWPLCQFVCHRSGRPVATYRKEFERARALIGLPEMHFHDLRHAAVSNMVDAGIDEPRAMAIVGHKTSAMLRRYRVVAVRHVQAAGEKLETHFARGKSTPSPLTQ